nr:chorismate-binding protein [Longispora albida]
MACPPATPRNCQGTVRERERREWRTGDPGDPLAMTVSFLTAAGLPAQDLTALPGGECPGGPPGSVCGAAILLSAAAGSAAIGGPAGPPSPAPGVPDVAVIVYEHADPEPAAEGEPWLIGPWVPSWAPQEHAAAVSAVRTAISRGEVYQVNVVGHWAAACSGDPRPALTRIAGIPGAVYGGMLTGDGWALATASPELLVSVAGGTVTSKPIKGTRPSTPEGRAELLASVKERAEHIMIVDLVRNDLALVAETGSVAVTELFALRRWVALWQAESVVTARLRAGTGLDGLLRAVAPGGSVTGAPKLAALAQIAALETAGRGPAMGAAGYLSRYTLELGLTIRTVAVTQGLAHIWAGGGITWGSDPEAEVLEAAAKAGPLMAAMTPAGATAAGAG